MFFCLQSPHLSHSQVKRQLLTTKGPVGGHSAHSRKIVMESDILLARQRSKNQAWQRSKNQLRLDSEFNCCRSKGIQP